MSRALTHRGPDDAGVYLSGDGRVGLVNRRLAIVDLSPAGHMPMGSEDAGVWLTYNGEVYNAAALRRDLEAAGHRFRSTGDTEVVLRGYLQWGADVVHRLDGMFALGLYDGRGPRRLLLARDRLGIKPPHYAATGEAFVFASELRALQASGLVARRLSPAGLVGYLLLGSVPCPLTIYDGVQALEPGSTLTLEVGEAAPSPVARRYWTLPAGVETQPGAGDPVERVRGLLGDAVASHLVSDVPLGAFLSGGLDSSAVVALMRAATAGPIRTCSMVFEEARYSEAPYARAMAEAVSAEHHERVVTAGEVAAELDRIAWAMDQPTIDGVNSYFVARTAREAGLTVALSGLGGDELFGGYANTFAGVPRVLRAVRLARAVPAGASVTRAGLRHLAGPGRWARVADALTRPASPASAYIACRGLFSPGEARDLLPPDVWEAGSRALDPVREVARRADAPDGRLFSWVSRAELLTYTHHQLLRDTDVMSMAHSLEVRVPLLDHRLVEGVLGLPEAARRDGGPAKGLLRRAVADLLPAAVRDRRDKQGFVFPFDAWLRGPLRRTCREWQAGLTGLLRPEAVARVQDAYEAGRLHWSRAWALAALQGWRQAAGVR
jgi:asparagine synthase (glutamine-hydrolysing)